MEAPGRDHSVSSKEKRAADRGVKDMQKPMMTLMRLFVRQPAKP
jgi:hypothetical protein